MCVRGAEFSLKSVVNYVLKPVVNWYVKPLSSGAGGGNVRIQGRETVGTVAGGKASAIRGGD